MGFSRPVRFDGIAAILVCKSERDLGRVSKLPRGAGVGVSIVGERKRKHRGTVTASHRLAFKSPLHQQRQHLIGQLDNSSSIALTA